MGRCNRALSAAILNQLTQDKAWDNASTDPLKEDIIQRIFLSTLKKDDFNLLQ